MFLRLFRGFDIEPVFDSQSFSGKKEAVIRYRKGPSQAPKVWILMVALEVWKLSVPKKHWFPRRSSSFEAESAASTAATEEGPFAGPP